MNREKVINYVMLITIVNSKMFHQLAHTVDEKLNSLFLCGWYHFRTSLTFYVACKQTIAKILSSSTAKKRSVLQRYRTNCENSSRKKIYLHRKRICGILNRNECIYLLVLGFLSTLISFWATIFYHLHNINNSLSGASNAQLQLYPPEDSLPELLEDFQPVKFPETNKSIQYDQLIVYNDFNFLNAETLTYEQRIYSNNMLFLYRFPTKKNMVGLVFLFHSCETTAMDWFQSIEHQRIVGAAIEIGLGCVALQPLGNRTGCWSLKTPSATNHDVLLVLSALDNFYREHSSIVSLPMFSFGVSNGALFSSIFVTNQRYTIRGQVICLGIIVPTILNEYIQRNWYPPTVWIHVGQYSQIFLCSISNINSYRI